MRKVVVFSVRQIAIAICATFLLTPAAQAQLPATRLSAIFPTGAQTGTSIDVTITSGVELEEVSKLLFSHSGITAAQKMQDVGGKPTPIANTFVVTVAADVPPGQHEVRAIGFFGISNPRFFIVGAQKEQNEVEPNNAREQATPVEINQLVNGRANPAADIDWFKFQAKAGQRVLVSCMARRLDSRLDSALELYNAAGKRLDFARRNQSGLDSLLDIAIPADGEYFIKLYDFTYAGGEEYPYRLSFTTGPYIDYTLPASGIPDSNAQFTIYGRNLPGSKPAGISTQGHPLEKLTVNFNLPAIGDLLDPLVKLEPFSAGIDAVPFSIASPQGPSNTVMIQLSKFVPVVEAEPNDKGPQAQQVVVPIEINGQFQTRNDVDCFEFEAKANETYWVEVLAHRAGAAIDPVLVIDQIKKNDKGEETLARVSALDDDATNPLLNLFDTLNDDNTVKFAAPADGKYRVTLRERYGNAKQDLSVYRLMIRKESPDFRVAAVATALTPPATRQAAPSGITLRRGDNFPVHVIAFRRDGFSGPITVSAEGLPPGVTCRDISIGAAPSSGVIVFSSAEDAPAWAGTVKLIAKAKIDDPAAVEAVTAANAAAKAATDALAAATKALTKPADDLAKANEALTAAKAELAAKADDAALKQKVADAEAKVIAANTAYQPLATAKTAAEQKLNDANAAVQRTEAHRVATAREVTHPARYGTVLWGAPQANAPADARVAQSIELSVIEEPSPFQLTTELHRIEANHNRQILVPVKVVRRNGFDQAVTLTVVSPPTNAQVESKPIPQGKDEEVYRVFIPANAPVGTYVAYLTGQAGVSYRKNPAKADKAKAELDEADKALNSVTEEIKALTAGRDGAIKKVEDETANLKKLTESKQLLEKNLTDVQAAEKAAAEAVKAVGDNTEAKVEAEKKLGEAQSTTKAAADALAAAEKARVAGEEAIKAADALKVKAEADLKVADEKSKALTAVKTAVDARFKAADAYAKAASINFHPPTTPIVITVKPAPYTVTATPPDGGAIKIGGKMEVKVEVKRQNGFTGPVILSLPLPPNTVGIKADPVTIPGDQSAGTLTIEAAADAPEVAFANLVIRATAPWNGEANVDQPVTLKTVK